MRFKLLLDLVYNLFYTDFFSNYFTNVLLASTTAYNGLVYIFFGSLLKILLILSLLVLLVHIRLSIKAILKDYIYNKSVVYFCEFLNNLILIRIIIELIFVIC